MIITVDDSPVGGGKTHNALQSAITQGGRWLFAVERIDLMTELVQRIGDMKKSMRRHIAVVPISSSIEQSVSKRGESVMIQVEALPQQYPSGNVIALCTHEAMLKCDFRGFEEWHVVCDEVPSSLHIEKMRTRFDRGFFERFYELEHLHGDWSIIKPTAEGLELVGGKLAHCDSHVRLRKLHETVVGFSQNRITQAASCNLPDWASMEHDNLVWVWWSQFSFSHLSPFASVTILASRFFESFAYKIAEQWTSEIDWKRAPALPVRPFASRKVAVTYFSEKQLASKSFFSSTLGKRCLAKIGQHITETAPTKSLIWSCNNSTKKTIEAHLPKSGYEPPRQAGTSSLMSNTAAAMIYAAKPSNEVMLVLKAIGALREDWIRTVELEAIIQFVSRTSVRDPSSTANVKVFVFDRVQAEAVACFFESQRQNTVAMEYIDIGLADRISRVGRPKRERTPQEAEVHAIAFKAKRVRQQRERRAKAKASEFVS